MRLDARIGKRSACHKPVPPRTKGRSGALPPASVRLGASALGTDMYRRTLSENFLILPRNVENVCEKSHRLPQGLGLVFRAGARIVHPREGERRHDPAVSTRHLFRLNKDVYFVSVASGWVYSACTNLYPVST
jgi:hypothetical protein